MACQTASVVHVVVARRPGLIDRAHAKTFRDYTILPILERKQNGSLGPVSKATAGWDERLGRTEIQRRKEEASDYRYFPDPDLVPVLSHDLVEEVRGRVPELPKSKRARFVEQYQVSASIASAMPV